MEKEWNEFTGGGYLHRLQGEKEEEKKVHQTAKGEYKRLKTWSSEKRLSPRSLTRIRYEKAEEKVVRCRTLA